MATPNKPDKPNFTETDSNELIRKEKLLQDLLDRPRPWKNNDDRRHNLLITNLENNLKPSLIEIINKHKAEETVRTLYNTEVTFGNAAIEAYDKHKAKFAEQRSDRYAMLHSLPQNSAAYRVQKRFCDAMDKVQKDFLSKLTDPDFLRKNLHNNFDHLQTKIDVEQKSVFIKTYIEDKEIIARQTAPIRAQFSAQYQQVFPDAKNQAWIERSQQNIKELQALVNQQTATTKAQAKDDSVVTNRADKRAALAAQHQQTLARNQAIREAAAEQTKTIQKTQTVTSVAKQAVVTPEAEVNAVTTPKPSSLPTPKPTHSAKKEDEKEEHKSQELDRPLLVKGGRALGYGFGVVTEKIAEVAVSVLKTAVFGAWELAKAAAEQLGNLAKSSETLAAEKMQAEAKTNASLPTPAPASSKASEENNQPSLYVKATTMVGGIVAWGVQTACDGGIALGAFAIQASVKLYATIAAPNEYAKGHEGELKTGHSKPAKNNALANAAANSTLSVTPSNDTKLDNAPSTTPTPSPIKNR